MFVCCLKRSKTGGETNAAARGQTLSARAALVLEGRVDCPAHSWREPPARGAEAAHPTRRARRGFGTRSRCRDELALCPWLLFSQPNKKPDHQLGVGIRRDSVIERGERHEVEVPEVPS